MICNQTSRVREGSKTHAKVLTLTTVISVRPCRLFSFSGSSPLQVRFPPSLGSQWRTVPIFRDTISSENKNFLRDWVTASHRGLGDRLPNYRITDNSIKLQDDLKALLESFPDQVTGDKKNTQNRIIGHCTCKGPRK